MMQKRDRPVQKGFADGPLACIGRPSEFCGSMAGALSRALTRMFDRKWRVTMAVPKRKVSRMKRGFRRSADGLAAPTYVEDKDSGELRRPHHVDLKSGMYRGRQILEPKDE